VTPNTVLQGSWLLLLQRYRGQRTVAFGAAFADRPADSPGARELPGLVPILPIIQSPWREQMAGDWLRALRNDILAMREIQHAPLGRIQRLAGRSGEALFDSIIVFETCSADETLRRRSGVMHAPDARRTNQDPRLMEPRQGKFQRRRVSCMS
jgi:non-ribosomal peptide synthetase component F